MFGGVRDRHILMDSMQVINGGVMKLETGDKITIPRWDLIIAHPPCTYLINCATRHHSLAASPINWINGRTLSRISAMEFFMRMVSADCDRIAIENPVGIMNTAYRKPDQIIDPWMFSDGPEDRENFVTKRTCLWLKGLPPLLPKCSDRPDNAALYGKFPSGKSRTWEDSDARTAQERSKTFPGIAKAMAEQWG